MDLGRRLIMHALRRGAFEFNESGFELKSGLGGSPYFFNIKKLNSGGDLITIADLYAEALGPDLIHDCDGVIGPPMAGTILAGPVVMGIWNRYSPSEEFRSYSYRPQVKKHGEKGKIIGGSIDGKKLILVDDAFTAGTSFTEALEVVQDHGGIPVACVVAFDRQQLGVSGQSKSKEFSERTGLTFLSIANMHDLVWGLSQKKLKLENRMGILAKVEEYRGVNCYLGF